MQRHLKRDLLEHAYFIAGQPSFCRKKSDLSIKKPIRNAVCVFDRCDISDRPTIASGTTSSPNVVLRFYWLLTNNNANRIVSLHVDFNKDDTCSVGWDNPDGSFYEVRDIKLSEVLALNIPAKVRDLRNAQLQPKNFS